MTRLNTRPDSAVSLLKSITQSPSREFSLFFGVYVAYFVFPVAYLSLHCEALGFTAAQIALIFAGQSVASIIAPSLGAHLAHHFISPRRVVLVFSVACVVLGASLFFATGFLPFLLLWALLHCCHRGYFSLASASALRTPGVDYGQTRLWGSVTFVFCVLGVGYLYDRIGPGVILPGAMVLLVATVISNFVTRHIFSDEVRGKTEPVQTSIWRELKNNAALRYLMSIEFLAWGSHAVLYTYLSIYLKAIGWSGTMISVAWGIGVVAEILMFHFFIRFERRWSLYSLLYVTLFCTAFRWVVLACFQDTTIILISQALHAFSFGSAHIIALKLVQQFTSDIMSERAQGVISSIGGGLGLCVGQVALALTAGFVVASTQLNVLFWFAAVLVLAALCLVGPMRRVSAERT